jgi:hypothetical protein
VTLSEAEGQDPVVQDQIDSRPRNPRAGMEIEIVLTRVTAIEHGRLVVLGRIAAPADAADTPRMVLRYLSKHVDAGLLCQTRLQLVPGQQGPRG